MDIMYIDTCVHTTLNVHMYYTCVFPPCQIVKVDNLAVELTLYIKHQSIAHTHTHTHTHAHTHTRTTPCLKPNSMSSLWAEGERGEEGVFPACTGSRLSVLLSQLETTRDTNR